MSNKPNVQHNVEDKAFKGLIKKFTKRRDWPMVQALFHDYGRILEMRDEEAKPMPCGFHAWNAAGLCVSCGIWVEELVDA